MGVDRTDYLMWGAKVDPDDVSKRYDELEPEMYGEDGRRFDLVYDGMGGKYAVAGKVIAQSGKYDGLEFCEISQADAGWSPEVVAAVRAVFPDAQAFALYLFSHYR